MNLTQLNQVLASRTPSDPQAAVVIVDSLLTASAAAGASDLHLLPTADGLNLAWRIDGVLQPLGKISPELATNVVTRLKVLARLLTYRTNLPQEGRIASTDAAVEVRISTFPTLYGEKVVARNLPRDQQPLARIGELGLPADVSQSLNDSLRQTSGAVLIVGPAGSGKTTTAYACLREIIAATSGQRSVVSLEDPVEAAVEGVAQSQVAASAGFDLLTGLRSLVRQDPEVIFIGEIRDADAAQVALQAALTGQLLLSTFHATDAAAALSRLGEMGIPPYAIRSGVRTIIAQRLLRRFCSCATPTKVDPAALPFAQSPPASSVSIKQRVGCDRCRQTGYVGRTAVAEVLHLDTPGVGEMILSRADAPALRRAAFAAGVGSLLPRAAELVSSGVTSVDEVVRVFGLPVAAPSN